MASDTEPIAQLRAIVTEHNAGQQHLRDLYAKAEEEDDYSDGDEFRDEFGDDARAAMDRVANLLHGLLGTPPALPSLVIDE